MGTFLGVELTPCRCSLVSAVPGGDGQATVQAFHTIRYTPGDGRELASELSGVLETRAFPGRARVVLWGVRSLHRFVPLPEGTEADLAEHALRGLLEREPAVEDWSGDALVAVSVLDQHRRASAEPTHDCLAVAVHARDVRRRLWPLTRVGLTIDRVITPAMALAAYAQLRWEPSEEATAFFAMNVDGGVLVVAHQGRLVDSRDFAWEYREDPVSGAARLKQRYQFASNLAPSIRTVFEEVRAAHGVGVTRLVTCGDLPDLRSLTMPFIEVLDVEAETLDSMDGIDIGSLPEPREQFREQVAHLRLACAVALSSTALGVCPPRTRRLVLPTPGAARTAAAAAGLVVVAGAGVWLWGLARDRSTVDRLAEVAPVAPPGPRPTALPPPSAQRGRAAGGDVELEARPPIGAPEDRASPGEQPRADTRPPMPAAASVISVPPARLPAIARSDSPAARPAGRPADEAGQPVPSAPPGRTGGVALPASPEPRVGQPGANESTTPPTPRVQSHTPTPAPAPASGRVGTPSKNMPGPAPAAAERPVATAARDPVVRSILYSATRRLAVVDDRVVSVGDSVDSFVVVDITPNAVVFRAPGGEVKRVVMKELTGR